MKIGKLFGYLCLILVLLVFFSGCNPGNIPLSSSSQDEELAKIRLSATGSVSGMVKNSTTGLPIPGAKVEVVGTTLSATTDSSGRYFLGNVPIGQRILSVSARGYVPQTRSISVRAGRTTTANFSLKPEVSSNTSPTPTPTPTPTPAPTPTPTPAPTPTSTPAPTDLITLLTTYGYGKNTVVRWADGIVEVYNTTTDSGIDLAQVLNEWNGIIGGKTVFRVSNNPQSPVQIVYDTSIANSGAWGYAVVYWSNYTIYKAKVGILPAGYWYGYYLKPEYRLYLHEMGHVVGFSGHTSEGGVMDPTPKNSTITETPRAVISGLYSFPPGYTLAKGVPVPSEGMAVVYFWKE